MTETSADNISPGILEDNNKYEEYRHNLDLTNIIRLIWFSMLNYEINEANITQASLFKFSSSVDFAVSSRKFCISTAKKFLINSSLSDSDLIDQNLFFNFFYKLIDHRKVPIDDVPYAWAICMAVIEYEPGKISILKSIENVFSILKFSLADVLSEHAKFKQAIKDKSIQNNTPELYYSENREIYRRKSELVKIVSFMTKRKPTKADNTKEPSPFSSITSSHSERRLTNTSNAGTLPTTTSSSKSSATSASTTLANQSLALQPQYVGPSSDTGDNATGFSSFKTVMRANNTKYAKKIQAAVAKLNAPTAVSNDNDNNNDDNNTPTIHIDPDPDDIPPSENINDPTDPLPLPVLDIDNDHLSVVTPQDLLQYSSRTTPSIPTTSTNIIIKPKHHKNTKRKKANKKLVIQLTVPTVTSITEDNSDSNNTDEYEDGESEITESEPKDNTDDTEDNNSYNNQTTISLQTPALSSPSPRSNNINTDTMLTQALHVVYSTPSIELNYNNANDNNISNTTLLLPPSPRYILPMPTPLTTSPTLNQNPSKQLLPTTTFSSHLLYSDIDTDNNIELDSQQQPETTTTLSATNTSRIYFPHTNRHKQKAEFEPDQCDDTLPIDIPNSYFKDLKQMTQQQQQQPNIHLLNYNNLYNIHYNNNNKKYSNHSQTPQQKYKETTSSSSTGTSTTTTTTSNRADYKNTDFLDLPSHLRPTKSYIKKSVHATPNNTKINVVGINNHEHAHDDDNNNNVSKKNLREIIKDSIKFFEITNTYTEIDSTLQVYMLSQNTHKISKENNKNKNMFSSSYSLQYTAHSQEQGDTTEPGEASSSNFSRAKYLEEEIIMNGQRTRKLKLSHIRSLPTKTSNRNAYRSTNNYGCMSSDTNTDTYEAVDQRYKNTEAWNNFCSMQMAEIMLTTGIDGIGTSSSLCSHYSSQMDFLEDKFMDMATVKKSYKNVFRAVKDKKVTLHKVDQNKSSLSSSLSKFMRK